MAKLDSLERRDVVVLEERRVGVAREQVVLEYTLARAWVGDENDA